MAGFSNTFIVTPRYITHSTILREGIVEIHTQIKGTIRVFINACHIIAGYGSGLKYLQTLGDVMLCDAIVLCSIGIFVKWDGAVYIC